MNFIEFLKNNSSIPITPSPTTKPTTKQQQQQHPRPQKNPQQNTNVTNVTTDIVQQLQKGNFVRIVKYKNSIYNYYKNYIGEIKEYNPFQNTVTVFLHAPPSLKLLHLHEDHVIKI